MSNWLKNVGNLLEKLDDRAEQVAEERREVTDYSNHGDAAIDHILTKRGLSLEATDSQDTNDEDIGKDVGLAGPSFATSSNEVTHTSPLQAQTSSSPTQHDNTTLSAGTKQDSIEEGQHSNSEDGLPLETGAVSPPESESATAARPSDAASTKSGNKISSDEAKEARMLRRHVVTLSSQLDAAESELSAQRTELERAAERIEKDRKRAKEEKDKAKKQHAEEIATLKASQEQNLRDQQARFEEKLVSFEKKVAEMEDRRRQEGGDWSKEMGQAIEREQEMSQRVTLLEDEKSVLLSQLSTLQGQQAALGSRLESLSQAADNAMARGREAEDRLDTVLSQHARQISQRQARETELEYQIQDLGAALVKAKSVPDSSRDTTVATHDSAMEARLEALQAELENALGDLAIERENVRRVRESESTLLNYELQTRVLGDDPANSPSARGTDELKDQVELMSEEVDRLKEKITAHSGESLAMEQRLQAAIGRADNAEEQVKLLSKEVYRLREKIANSTGESLAMKHRLKAAIDRANKAEDELGVATTNTDNPFGSMERAERGYGYGPRRRQGPPKVGSMRSAMMLSPGQGDQAERIGKVVDVVDSFAVSTGKYLRRNPLARAGFIFYLVLVHLWTFVLLFFHAHNFEIEHGDFGAGAGKAHGPHAMMAQQVEIKPDTAQSSP